MINNYFKIIDILHKKIYNLNNIDSKGKYNPLKNSFEDFSHYKFKFIQHGTMVTVDNFNNIKVNRTIVCCG